MNENDENNGKNKNDIEIGINNSKSSESCSCPCNSCSIPQKCCAECQNIKNGCCLFNNKDFKFEHYEKSRN